MGLRCSALPKLTLFNLLSLKRRIDFINQILTAKRRSETVKSNWNVISSHGDFNRVSQNTRNPLTTTTISYRCTLRRQRNHSRFQLQAFENGFPDLTGNNVHVHHLGDLVFNQAFAPAPAVTYGGLGPIFNNTSCINCHQNNGMGAPTAGGPQSALLLRISLPGTDAHGGPVPVPGYGLQIQDKALPGVTPEATVNIAYTYTTYFFHRWGIVRVNANALYNIQSL